MDREGLELKQASLITLGCKSNSFDTAVIWEGLRKRGYRLTDRPAKADLYVINTCTVTNSAGSQSRQIIRKAKRLNPDSLVIVTGCHAQVNSREVSEIEGVDYVIGNNEREQIFDIVDKIGKDREKIIVSNVFEEERFKYMEISSFQAKSRAYLKIQDGCDAYCTYCIIPYARGRSRSLPVEKVESQVVGMTEAGHKEIVLTGIHIGGYGSDLPGKINFLYLLRRLEDLDVDVRYRISSIEPTEIEDELLGFLTTTRKFCRHLHIPLQSGDDEILKKMGRYYSGSYYLDKLRRIEKKWDGVAIGIDIISGFPGETDQAFKNSYNLIKSCPAAYLHAFPYSKRNGTPASAMSGQVESTTIKARCAELRTLGEEKKMVFCRSQLGKRLEVVSLEETNGHIRALTDNYIEVMLKRESEIKASIYLVELMKFENNKCYGKIIN